MNKKNISALLVTLILLVMCFGCSKETNEQTKTYKLRTSANLGEKGTIGQALQYFVDQVNERSNGKILATANFGSELGSQLEQVEMTQSGALDMVVAAPGTGLGGWVPELVMYEFPYLFKDNEQYRRILFETTPRVSELVKEYGFTAASGQSQGARNILTIKPINTIEDIKGVKMRGPNSVYTDMFDSLGAAGTITGWNDIYTSLQTKLIEGCEASPSAIYSMKFNEVATNMTVTNHIIACTYYFFNTEWLESLPEDLQKIVLECADDAAKYQAEIDDKDQIAALDKMTSNGLNVIELTDDERQKFVDACSGMLDNYRKKGENWNSFIDLLLSIN